ncbi:MAG: hypothetical protein RLZZ476_2592 [Verrucomicrobiota bacterium]|jgi:hypothetical protein
MIRHPTPSSRESRSASDFHLEHGRSGGIVGGYAHRVEKDLGDVVALLRGNPGKISAAELQGICDQYGTPALAEKLSAFL